MRIIFAGPEFSEEVFIFISAGLLKDRIRLAAASIIAMTMTAIKTMSPLLFFFSYIIYFLKSASVISPDFIARDIKAWYAFV